MNQFLTRFLTACAATLGLWAAAGSAQAQQVGVSVSVNQPGLYGRIDIGHAPAPPVLVYPQPVVYAPGPVAVYRQPIYLHVPPGHYKHWGKYCGRYAACGQPVYFVQDRWYRDHYRPRPQRVERHVHHHHHHQYRRDDRRDDRGHRGRDHGDRGHGKHRD